MRAYKFAEKSQGFTYVEVMSYCLIHIACLLINRVFRVYHEQIIKSSQNTKNLYSMGTNKEYRDSIFKNFVADGVAVFRKSDH